MALSVLGGSFWSLFLGRYKGTFLIDFAFQPLVETPERLSSAPLIIEPLGNLSVYLDDKNGFFVRLWPPYCLYSGETLGAHRIKAHTILLVNEVLS